MKKKKAIKIAAASAIAASAFVATAPVNSFAASKPVVKSVSAINPITVTVGKNPTLPTWVYVQLSDKSIHKSPVKWNTKSLNVKKAGTYTLVGTVNGTSLKASVKVVVKAAAPAPVVKSPVAATVDPVTVTTTEGTDASLPTWVRVTYTDKSVHHVPVDAWDTTSVDTSKAGTYTANGKVRGTSIPAKATVVVKAAADTQKPVITLNGDATVNVANGAAYTDAGATVTDNKDTNLQATATITDAAGNVVTAIDTKVAGTYTVTYTAVDAAGNKADAVTRTVVVAAKPAPQVSSVSALNLKQVQVVFNTPVDQTTAENAANYTLTTSGGATVGLDASQTPVLQKDGKTVVLTLANLGAANQSTDSLKVSGVKTTDGTVVPDSTNSVTFVDTAIPTVQSITVTGPNTARVFFSEPVQGTILTSAFTLDNGTYGVASATVVSNQQNAVDVTFGSNLSSGSHTLTVNGDSVSSYAGFSVNKVDVPFTVTPATTAPTVSLVSATQSQVVVKFSEPIQNHNLINFYHTFNNNAATAPTNVAWANDNQTVTLTFANTGGNVALPTGNATIYVNNTAASTSTTQPSDNWGNAFKSTTLTASITADTTAPTVTSVKYIDGTHIDVAFNKAVTNVTSSAFTLTDSKGNNMGVASVAPSPTGAANTYRLTTGTGMNGDTYTLKIGDKVITDTTVNANPLAAYSTTVTVPDTTAPTVNSVTSTTSNGVNKIYVYFSKAVNATEATNVNNYRFATDGSGNGATLLPNGTSITMLNNNTLAQITLPSGTSLPVGLVVLPIHDTLGNLMVSNIDKAVSTDNITSSNVENVKATGTNTITFEVNQPLSATNASDVTINGVAAGTVSYVNQTLSDGKTYGALVTVKLPSNDTTDAWTTALTDLGNTALDIQPGALTSSLGSTNLDVQVTKANVADGIAPALKTITTADNVIVNPSTGAQTAGQDGKLDEVDVTFTEPVLASTIGLNSFNVNGYTVTDVQPVSPSNGYTNTFKVLVKEQSVNDTGVTPTVILENNTKDIAGNILASGATVATTDGAAPIATGDFTNSNANVVTINFSEAMDPATLVSSNFSSTKGGTITGFSKAADNKSVTITFTTGLAAADTVAIASAVQDANGNAIATTTLTK